MELERLWMNGFSNEEGTKPGFSGKNDSFSVRLESIQIEELSNVPVEFTVDSKDHFESYYDWTPIMEIILDCLEDNHDKGAFQISCEVSFKARAWLGEPGGFNLFFSLQHSSTRRILIDLCLKNILEIQAKAALSCLRT